MGIDLTPMEGVEEVVIRTHEKEIILKDPNVSEVKAKDMRIFQVMGTSIEERIKEKPKFSEEDIFLVMQQANTSRERAVAALEDCGGETARAIIKLLG